ncbi:hypothetical protein [Tomitella biformata]|uniref:hypothetical protein n=1 Tax=Tomitella biformata TaxID=630403 RepID=UPI0004B9955B|nr:hypothetical protein [Tomitella biformata]
MSSNKVSRRTFLVGAAVTAATALAATKATGSVPSGLGAPATSDPTITARQRFFGVENVDASTGAVDPGKAILSWFGVSNFAMAIGGNIVLLDAWVPRGGFSNYVPTSPR